MTPNKPYENFATFEHSVMTVTNQNCINWLVSIQFTFFCLPVSSVKFKMKMYKTIRLPFSLHVCETWSLTPKIEQGGYENICT